MTRDDSANDPQWARLVSLVTGELSPDEAAALRRWVEAAPERLAGLAQVEAIWQATEASAELDAANGEAELRRIKAEAEGGGRLIARVGPPEPRRSGFDVMPHRDGRVRALLRAAAALTLVVAGGLLWRSQRPTPGAAPSVTAPAAMTEYRTSAGERLTLNLPDGTEVRLAPGSILRRSSDYGVRGRLVQLEGEAYFAVAHDSGQPFVVSTGRAVARVLGTRFVVRSYAEEPATDVVVAEGRVAVRRAYAARGAVADVSPVDSLILGPRDHAAVTADGELRLTTGVALDRHLSWTEGRLMFEDTPLRVVVQRLGRWYGIDLRLADSSLHDRRLTATLRNETAPQAVDLVATVLGLSVSRSQGAYVLRNVGR